MYKILDVSQIEIYSLATSSITDFGAEKVKPTLQLVFRLTHIQLSYIESRH